MPKRKRQTLNSQNKRARKVKEPQQLPQLKDSARKDGIEFVHLYNDLTFDSMKLLIKLKMVFGKQLPNMGLGYISRLVFDPTHKSLIAMKDGKHIVGGITYKPFDELGYIEIAFVAVDGTYQIRGCGRLLMNNLKRVCQEQKLFRFLTYADNEAVGYFAKMGFSKDITCPKNHYQGFIKTYNGVTLMECVIRPDIDYCNSKAIIEAQSNFVLNRLQSEYEMGNNRKVYPGLVRRDGKLYSNDRLIKDISEIPGVDTCRGYVPSKPDFDQMQKNFRAILEYMKNHEKSWPFRAPVTGIADYEQYIRTTLDSFPVDMTLIERRLNQGFYRTEDIFSADWYRMFENCRQYNLDSTPYPALATSCEKIFNQQLIKYKYMKPQERQRKSRSTS